LLDHLHIRIIFFYYPHWGQRCRYFSSHTPIDRDVVDSFASQFCHSGTDAPRRSKRTPKSAEPLRVGEQVYIYLFVYLLFIMCEFDEWSYN
jgi:hypothetical protein